MKYGSTVARLRWLAGAGLALVLASAQAEDVHKGFADPQAAVDALVAALEAGDDASLAALLGPGSEDVLFSGDAVADAAAKAGFLEGYQEQHALVDESDGSKSLTTGKNEWPLPVPLVKRAGQWFLDGAAGVDEIVYRRVGRNELGAIAVCRGFIDAQIEYASQPRDGDPEPGVFAMKLRSDEGRQNGLYWPTAAGEAPSPAGEAIARAAADGYRAVVGKRTPYRGYYYRMLYAQGASANGGAKEYFDNGELSGGIALIAWPAMYEVSGVKSFIVNQEGVVFEKDLGEDTPAAAAAIEVFDPDSSWSKVELEDAG